MEKELHRRFKKHRTRGEWYIVPLATAAYCMSLEMAYVSGKPTMYWCDAATQEKLTDKKDHGLIFPL